MGGYVYSQTDSGIIRADLGADGAAIDRALREHDPDLRLIPQRNERLQKTLWMVYRKVNGDRSEFLLAWQTDRGEPLPLSMALVDEVQRHDRNTRGAVVESAVANEQLREENRKDFEREKQAAIDDWIPRAEKGRLPVFHKSPALAVARRRGRRRGVSG